MGESVSNGKTLVANAITAKGVSTSTSAEFETMATNIKAINTSRTVERFTVGAGSSVSKTIKHDSSNLIVATSFADIDSYGSAKIGSSKLSFSSIGHSKDGWGLSCSASVACTKGKTLTVTNNSTVTLGVVVSY